MADKPNYKQTMNLPQTKFSMKAGLPQNEPKRLAKWEEMDLYNKLLAQNEGNEPFVLHDGPPYANGPIHIGHALNKVLKDIIVKYHAQRGQYSPYVPGWDCHGLPIENKVENKLGPEKMAKIDTPTFRKICRQYAEEQLAGQMAGFKRLGVLGEWDNPYLTFLPEYEAGNISIFKMMYLNGSIYRGRKPIHWCSHCHTALAEAEIEYGDETSPSIFVKFAVSGGVPAEMAAALEAAGVAELPLSIVIWTTTPWTLPANSAVSLAPEAAYVVVRAGDELMIMAEELAAGVLETAGIEAYEFVGGEEPFTLPGTALEGMRYAHPILAGEEGIVIYGNHVTLDAGTGCVHTAPGHGADDYLVAQNFEGVAMRMPVDDDGKFMDGGAQWAGQDAVGSNESIIEWLAEQGTLLARVDLTHSYPHCWRCHEPVIFRATTQWFVSMDKTGLREGALKAIHEDVQWVPSWASNRIGSMVADRPDWCISRQRFWGVPIPVFTCAGCGETVATEETFDAVIELFKEKGADAWYYTAPAEYLPEGCCCPSCGGKELTPDKDVLDVWWESGVSHTSVCEARDYLTRPADVYLEGSDQHRGWFHSSMLTSVGAYGVAPYKAVVSCGFTVDGEGRKMSKSVGNVIDPADVVAKYGADVLRLCVGSVDYKLDMGIDGEVLARTSEAYRRIRNNFRYLLGCLCDFSVDSFVPAAELLPFDRWALARLSELVDATTKAYDEYHFHHVFRGWTDFIGSMSSTYFDAIKDRLYSEAPGSFARRSAQTVLAHMLAAQVRQLNPILSFTCDEVWEEIPEGLRPAFEGPAAMLGGWYSLADVISAEDCAAAIAAFEPVLAARDAVTKALEEARAEGKFNKSQEAEIALSAPAEILPALAEIGEEALADIFIVSKVQLVSAAEGGALSASAGVSEDEKCPRCWNFRELGEDGLCCRCHEVLETIGYEA